jgi:hypothetical protein
LGRARSPYLIAVHRHPSILHSAILPTALPNPPPRHTLAQAAFATYPSDRPPIEFLPLRQVGPGLAQCLFRRPLRSRHHPTARPASPHIAFRMLLPIGLVGPTDAVANLAIASPRWRGTPLPAIGPADDLLLTREPL